MSGRNCTRGFKYLEGAVDIAFEVRPRIFDGITHTRLRSEMDDSRGFMRLEQFPHQARCFDMANYFVAFFFLNSVWQAVQT